MTTHGNLSDDRNGGVSSRGILRITGSEQVVGFFDVAARLNTRDGPIAALVGGSSCSIFIFISP